MYQAAIEASRQIRELESEIKCKTPPNLNLELNPDRKSLDFGRKSLLEPDEKSLVAHAVSDLGAKTNVTAELIRLQIRLARAYHDIGLGPQIQGLGFRVASDLGFRV